MDKFNIIKNNEIFFLTKDKIEELVKKRNTIGRNKNITYEKYILRNSEDFESELLKLSTQIVNTDEEYDIVYLLGNFDRIKKYVAGLEIYDDIKYNREYQLYKFSSKKDIKDFIKTQDYIVFDLETTGFGKLDQITQFGAITYVEGKPNGKIEFLLEPYKMEIGQIVTELTGITNRKLQKEGKNRFKVADVIYNLLHDKNIIAHNIGFDFNKIQEFFIDLGRDIPKPKRIIDSMDIAKIIVKEDLLADSIKALGLNNLVKQLLGIDISKLEERHTALFDVVNTKKVIDKLLEDREKGEIEIFGKEEKKKNKKENNNQRELFSF